MDKVTQEDISPQLKLTSPLSTKRLRTDWTVKTVLSEISIFDSSEPPTVQKSCLQNSESLQLIAECGHFWKNNPRDKPQNDTLNLTHLTTSQSCVVKESDEVCFVSAELTVKPSVTEIDKLSPYMRMDTDESPPPTNNTTSSPPNCKQLWKSCEAETPGCFSLYTENYKDGTQSNESQRQTVPFCSNQIDCSSKEPEKDKDLCQLVKVMETNQERLDSDFSNSVPLSKAKDKSPISSQPEEDLSGNMAEDGKKEKQKPEPQCCKKENLPVCDVKTKVNENDLSKALFCSAATCAEGSNLPNPVMLDANIAGENVSFDVNNYIGADQLSETSKISQEVDSGAEAAGIKEGEKPAHFLKEKQVDELWSFKQPLKISEMSDHMFICDGNLKCTDGEQGNKAETLSDKPDSHVMVVTTDGAEQRDRINGGKRKNSKFSKWKNSEIWEIFEDDKRNPTSMSSKKPDNSVSMGSPDTTISEWVEGSRFIICSGDGSEQSFSCFSHYQLSSDEFLNFPTANDAVVPCQPYLEHSKNPQYNSKALKCSNRLLPSALNLCNYMLRKFDTFEKIKLSPDFDHDEDAALSNMSFLTSLTGEMLKKPQQQLQRRTSKTVFDIHKSVQENEEAEEEKMEGIECHMENMTNTFVSCISPHIDASNSISATDVIELTWPERQPNCGSAPEDTHNESNPRSRSSATDPESDSPPSDLNHSFQFEMKEHFDSVLKELIRNDFANTCAKNSYEQCSDVPEPLESHSSKVTSEHLSSAELGCYKETSADKADEDSSLETSEVLSRDGEQEVPLNKNLNKDPLRDVADKHKEPQNREQEVKMWSPSIVYFPLLEQMRHGPPEQHRRLEPLKTCTRPIRVGLSKRAKTKHLHRSHPYK